MSIRKLKELLLPPIAAKDIPHNPDWNLPESKLGVFLPPDYKEFINIYGSSRIDEFLWVLNPFSLNENLNLLKQVSLQTEVLREIAEFDEIPFPIYPKKGALIPFAITDNGDILFWKTAGEPENWTVVVIDSRSSDYEEFNLNMTNFFASLLSHEIKCGIFPADFPSNEPTVRFYEN